MATRRWLGAAKQVTQVSTITITGTWSAADTVTVTINNIESTITVGSLTTTSQVATTLQQAWEGVTLTDTTAASSPTIADGGFKVIPEFYEVTATVSSNVVTLTARTSGKPVTISVSDTAASGTATHSVTTTATGKWFWDNVDNWSGNTVPVNNDDIVFDTGEVDLRYNLTTSMQPASVVITQGYTGKIGLAEVNADDTSKPYSEYRTKYLTFSNNSVTCTYTIGQGDGNGSRRIKIDAGAGQSTVIIHNTATRNELDFPTILFKGTHASNQFTIYKGDAGVAFLAGDTSTVATLRCGTEQGGSVKFVAGSGTTLTTVNTAGNGTVQLNSNCTTLTMTGCNVEYMAGAPATANVWNGTLIDRSTTTIGTALTVGTTGSYDRTYDTRAKTITPKVSLYKGARFLDPNMTLTYTGGVQFVGCKPSDTTFDPGFNRSITIS